MVMCASSMMSKHTGLKTKYGRLYIIKQIYTVTHPPDHADTICMPTLKHLDSYQRYCGEKWSKFHFSPFIIVISLLGVIVKEEVQYTEQNQVSLHELAKLKYTT